MRPARASTRTRLSRHAGAPNVAIAEKENEDAFLGYLVRATKSHQPLQLCENQNFRNMLSKISNQQFATGCVKSYVKRLEIVFQQQKQKKFAELFSAPGKISLTLTCGLKKCGILPS